MLRTPTPDGTEIAKLDVGNLEITYERVKPNAMGMERSEDRAQIVYILSGSMDMTVDGEQRNVRAGDVWLIPAGAPTGFQASDVECIRLIILG
jgi:quercetin dioxygenase-like cupin family protein